MTNHSLLANRTIIKMKAVPESWTDFVAACADGSAEIAGAGRAGREHRQKILNKVELLCQKLRTSPPTVSVPEGMPQEIARAVEKALRDLR
jgi:hypothetical protein